jgi:hypothetical protein
VPRAQHSARYARGGATPQQALPEKAVSPNMKSTAFPLPRETFGAIQHCSDSSAIRGKIGYIPRAECKSRFESLRGSQPLGLEVVDFDQPDAGRLISIAHKRGVSPGREGGDNRRFEIVRRRNGRLDFLLLS